jgi:hypothetical protein
MPDDDVAFVNMSIRESKWRQITKSSFVTLLLISQRFHYKMVVEKMCTISLT